MVHATAAADDDSNDEHVRPRPQGRRRCFRRANGNGGITGEQTCCIAIEKNLWLEDMYFTEIALPKVSHYCATGPTAWLRR